MTHTQTDYHSGIFPSSTVVMVLCYFKLCNPVKNGYVTSYYEDSHNYISPDLDF